MAIVKNSQQITVNAIRGYITAVNGAGIETWRGREASIKANENLLTLNGHPIAGNKVTINGQPPIYRIGESKFRGTIHIFSDGPNKLLVVNELDLEDYLAGLINSEISSNWPREAVKSQAVAARTYAIYQISVKNKYEANSRYDVESTVIDQVYHGAHREDRRAYEGVRATTGMVLTRSGVIFPSYYHSSCGGYTEHACNVWEGSEDSPAIVDRYCMNSPFSKWFLRIPREEFIGILTNAGMINKDALMLDISQQPFPNSPRADLIFIKTEKSSIPIKATELRKILGYKRLKSTWFNVGIEGNEVVFAGRGFGHGVGLCQWGAKSMAESGHNYKEILKHYYRDAEIGRMY